MNSIAVLLAIPLGACCAPAQQEESSFDWGGHLVMKVVYPMPKAIPDGVKAEAASPTLTSPFTLNSWTYPELHSFDPGPAGLVVEFGLFVETRPFHGDVEPYARLSLKYAFGPDKEGEYGKGYQHQQDMRVSVPSEFLYFIYGLSRTAFPLEPEAGVRFQFSKSLSGRLGASYEHVSYSFWEGFEAFGKPSWKKLGTSAVSVINVKASLELRIGDGLSVDIGALGAFGDERGGGGILGIRVDF